MAEARATTEVVLIGGEALQVVGPVEAVTDAISRGSQPEASGWAIFLMDDGSTIRTRCAAVAYVRKADGAVAAGDQLRAA